jgi:hypothetical protein
MTTTAAVPVASGPMLRARGWAGSAWEGKVGRRRCLVSGHAGVLPGCTVGTHTLPTLIALTPPLETRYTGGQAGVQCGHTKHLRFLSSPYPSPLFAPPAHKHGGARLIARRGAGRGRRDPQRQRHVVAHVAAKHGQERRHVSVVAPGRAQQQAEALGVGVRGGREGARVCMCSGRVGLPAR